MTKFQKVVLAIVAVVLVGLVGGIIFYVSRNDNLSSQENVMFNVLLTVFSIFLSLIISQFYFESSRQQSLNDAKKDFQSTTTLYAQKAAEKVGNLSNELSKLSVYLQEDDNRDLDPSVSLLIKEEKIRSSIHIIETLRSVNDKSLSDWRGVIPEEEIDEQLEARADREYDFMELVNSYRNVLQEQSSQADDIRPIIHEEVKDLRNQIDKLATSIIGTPIKKGYTPRPKVEVEIECPVCGEVIKYKQKQTRSSKKHIVCHSCTNRFLSTWNLAESHFELEPEPDKPEPTPPKIIPEADIQKVKSILPAQPWPKGTSKEIASKLQMSKGDVHRAIKSLIARGDFKQQVDGKLFENTEVRD